MTVADVRAHCDGRIAGYKIPRRVIVRSEPLPRNATGKLLKAVLKEMVLERS